MSTPTTADSWTTPSALAHATGINPRRFRRWIASGKIRAWRTPSGQLLIDPAAVAPLLKAMKAARIKASRIGARRG